jgi:hypothetical protein
MTHTLNFALINFYLDENTAGFYLKIKLLEEKHGASRGYQSKNRTYSWLSQAKGGHLSFTK